MERRPEFFSGFAAPISSSAAMIFAGSRAEPGFRRSASLALLLWSGLHGIVSLRVNKPTIKWPPAVELAEQFVRAIIRPDVAPR